MFIIISMLITSAEGNTGCVLSLSGNVFFYFFLGKISAEACKFGWNFVL